jgi:hypothetical protein
MKSRILALALAMSGVASAQQTFVLDGSQSNFTFSGTSPLGPIVGNPSNAFSLTETVDLLLQPGGSQPSAGGSFAGGNALAVPDIHGKITGPLGITVATIDIVGMRMTFHSGGFPVDPAGNFNGNVVVNIIAGTMTVDPLIGSTTVSDLTGAGSPLTAVSGSILRMPCAQNLDMPGVVLVFQFDVSPGQTATVTVSGDLAAQWTSSGAITYCTAKSGLVCGLPAISDAGCPDSSATSGYTISASPARGNRTGILLYGTSGATVLPFNGGLLCVSPTLLKRSTPVNSGGTNGGCDGVFSIDFNAFASGALGGNPLPALQSPGTQVDAQFWGRDSVGTGSFLSDGIEFVMD